MASSWISSLRALAAARIGHGRWLLAAPVLALCAACSPVFNWREVPVDAQLKALLPCKPDRAERELPIAPEGLQATLSMAGCMAGDATFAVAAWPGLAADEAPARLQLWQAATRAQWDKAIVQASAVAMPHMSSTPAPQHWLLLPPGEPARPQARMRWFAHADAQGRVTLYQATVLGQPSEAGAADTFFGGLMQR